MYFMKQKFDAFFIDYLQNTDLILFTCNTYVYTHCGESP